MTQDLEGIDIYHCPFFEVDSSGRLKFIMGAYYDRTPESFKTITEIYNIMRYCMWIIKKKDARDISKYAAIVYMNRVNETLVKIQKEYKKVIRKKQIQEEESLKKSISKPGRTYL
ncbi:MAG: hypothetical protein AABY15_01975 [Nanoarchaeota archaeon]